MLAPTICIYECINNLWRISNDEWRTFEWKNRQSKDERKNVLVPTTANIVIGHSNVPFPCIVHIITMSFRWISFQFGRYIYNFVGKVIWMTTLTIAPLQFMRTHTHLLNLLKFIQCFGICLAIHIFFSHSLPCSKLVIYFNWNLMF